MLLEIPAAVMLSQFIGVGVCGCSILRRVNITILPPLQLMNSMPSLDSAADATTNFNIPLITNSDPFNLIGIFCFDFLPNNNTPAKQLCACVSERCDASEWMFSTMSDA